MILFRICTIGLIFLGLISCAGDPIQRDFAFGEDPEEALLVVRKMPGAHETRVNVREVHLGEQLFAPGSAKPLFVRKSMTERKTALLLLGGPLAAALDRKEDSVLDRDFFILRLPPGDYAFVSHVTEEYTKPPSSLGRETRVITTHCYGEGAPVYRLTGGDINLVNLNDAKTESFAQLIEMKRELEGSENEHEVGSNKLALQEPEDLLRSILVDYPNVKGEVRTLPRIAKITFDGEKSFLRGSDCPKGMTINSVEIVEGDTESNEKIEE